MEEKWAPCELLALISTLVDQITAYCLNRLSTLMEESSADSNYHLEAKAANEANMNFVLKFQRLWLTRLMFPPSNAKKGKYELEDEISLGSHPLLIDYLKRLCFSVKHVFPVALAAAKLSQSNYQAVCSLLAHNHVSGKCLTSMCPEHSPHCRPPAIKSSILYL